MTIVAMIALLALQQDFEGGEHLRVAVEPQETIALFQRACLTPFADAKGFETAIAGDREALQRVDDGDVLPNRGGLRAPRVEIWHSDKYNVLYIFPDNLAMAVPAPQCQVASRLRDAPDPERLAVLIAASLTSHGTLVPVAKLPHAWDITGEGRSWRLFLRTQAGERGNFMSLRLMNLRS
jgi:hypothetical protein